MIRINRFGLGFVTILAAFLGVCLPSSAQNNLSDNAIYYVANTSPPDAYLALRTDPTSSFGQRIMAMPNGTLLQVLQRRPDGWWYVRVLPSGQEGWALSGQGNSLWIECCATGAIRETNSAQPYTPAAGSPERVAIMNAARAAGGQPILYKVNYLAVFRNGSKAIAVADMEDSAKQYPVGIVFFENMNGRWRALYLVGTDGSEDCKDVSAIYEKILAIANSLGAPPSFFPNNFLHNYAGSKMSTDDCGGYVIYDN
jgi:hypothetical protein